MDGLLDVYLRVLLWLALLACLAVLVVPALPRLKGRIGSWRVHRRLQQALPASHYTVLRDVTVRRATAAGVDTSQLDHVVISPYGIFVIASKHYSGWIFGAEREPQWTRVHFRSRRQFPNPLSENHAHVRALQELLGLDDAVFHSLVVFSGSAGIRTPMPPNVTRLGGLLPYIQVRTAKLLDFDEAARVAGVLAVKRLAPGVQSTAEHIASLRQTQGSRFSARQALLGLALMLSLVAVAGTLVDNLSEVPGQFSTRRAAPLACAWSAETGLCTCSDNRSGSGDWAVEIAEQDCRALPVRQSPVAQR
jgi:hypothetical protein